MFFSWSRLWRVPLRWLRVSSAMAGFGRASRATALKTRLGGLPAAIFAPLPFKATVTALALGIWCVDITSPAGTAIRRDLGLTETETGLIFSAFFIGRLVTSLPAGILVDRFGSRATLALGGILLLIGSITAALADSLYPLLGGRGIQGFGLSMVTGAGLFSMVRLRPRGGEAMTLFTLAAGTGGAFGLASGGLITSAFGWPWIYALSSVLAGVLLAIGATSWWLAYRSDPAVPVSPVESTAGATATAAEGAPVGRRAFLAALGANFYVYGLYCIWVVGLPLYAAEHYGASSGEIALMLMIINACHLLCAIPGGRLIRWLGSARALVVGLTITGTSLIGVLLAPGAYWLVIPMALYAAGQVIAGNAAGDLVLQLGSGSGRSVGFVRLTGDLGLVIGPAITGALAQVLGVNAPFLILAVVTVLVVGLVWRSAATLTPPAVSAVAS